MSVTSNPSESQTKTLLKKGILYLQSYSLLDIAVVKNREGNEVRLIKLRNPFGNYEWEGDWGDESKCWTEEAKKICDLQVADDGIFWMCLEDFQLFFISLHVGMYDERFKFSFLKKREITEESDFHIF